VFHPLSALSPLPASSGSRRSRKIYSRTRRSANAFGCVTELRWNGGDLLKIVRWQDSGFKEKALAAGVSVFELARVMGTSVAMIERHDGTLLERSGADIARRLDAVDVDQARATDDAPEAFRP
jgi:hypothetical protein